MNATSYVLPAAAMALLVLAVWMRLFFTRIPEMKRERIHPQSIALSTQAATKLRDTRAADNFRNLFELPVLFYVALWAGHALAIGLPAFFALAWLFVALRIVHSIIHCGYNKVLHRFYAYAAGGWVLWAMWAIIAWQALAR